MEEAGKSGPPQNTSRLFDLCEQCLELVGDIDALEQALGAKKSELHQLRSVKIPDEMASAQTTSFTLDRGEYVGFKFEVDDFVAGSFPKDVEKKVVAVEKLKEAGGEALLRGKLSVEFTVNEHNVGMALADDLKKQGFAVEYENTVNAQSLQAFAREKLKSGGKIDAEALGLFVGRMVKPKPPSKKKTTKTTPPKKAKK
jgi:hypothetical protein